MSVRYNVTFDIKDQDGFRKFAQQAIDATVGKPGTLTYEWFISEDNQQCLLVQEYADDDAILSHLATVGPEILPNLLTTCEIQTLQFLGDVSDRVRAAYKDLNPTYMSTMQAHVVH